MLLMFFLLILCPGLTQAQETLYQSAFEKAMADSVISADEQELLTLIFQAFDTSSAPQDTVVTKVEKPQKPGLTLNQSGRWRFIYSSMAVGNGLYGAGIPYLLHSENPSHYVGFQLLAAAGGFYFSYNQSQKMDISLGRMAFIERGATLGAGSFLILHSAVGVENWQNFDPNMRAAISYVMLGVPAGAYLGNSLFNKWQPGDGEALLLNFGSSLGALNGIALFRLINADKDIDTEEEFNQAYQTIVTLSVGGLLGGVGLTRQYLGQDSYTTGDAYFTSSSAGLGAYLAFQTLRILETANERVIILLGMSAVNGFSYMGAKSAKDVDFTEGDVAIIALGALAANGVWRGLSIMAGVDLSKDLGASLDIVTSLGGFYTTYRSIKARRLQKGGASTTQAGHTIKLAPTLMGDFNNLAPGFSLDIKF